jgi:peptide chain release factor subunit 1
MAQTDQLTAQLDRLAVFEPGSFPVISLYLNLQPNDHGREHFEPFLRKELSDRVRTYPAHGPERESLQNDVERIRRYMESVDRSARGLALFACDGTDLFDAIPLSAPIDEHQLHISNHPHLYGLARLLDEYPRYAVLLADTHSARIFVIAANRLERTTSVEAPKTHRHKMGGWAQARYQRHVENYYLHHAKEVADSLARVVREERIGAVIISGDEVIVPLLKEQFHKDVTERIVDELKLTMNAPESEVLRASLEALRGKDVQSDRERVNTLLDSYRASGLACVGVEDTLRAFELGQVDELVITSRPDRIEWRPNRASGRAGGERSNGEDGTADDLVAKARQTSASIRFIEDPTLLSPIGGVGAFLRFRL